MEDTTPSKSSKSSLMDEEGAREVLGPDSIIPLHIFLQSTQPERTRENMQFKMPPVVERDGRCRYSAAEPGETPAKWVCDCGAEQRPGGDH